MLTNPQQLKRVLVSAQSRLVEALRSERGAGLAEYALLLLLITVFVAAIVGTLGETISDRIGDAIAALGG